MRIERATDEDLRQVLTWFTTAEAARTWGGPNIQFPFELESLKATIDWKEADSYVFVGDQGIVIGFIQVLNKPDRKHLVRVAISPSMRGKGLGYDFIDGLLKDASYHGSTFTLFVYDDNASAIGLYKKLGFREVAPPDGVSKIGGCVFMERRGARL